MHDFKIGDRVVVKDMPHYVLGMPYSGHRMEGAVGTVIDKQPYAYIGKMPINSCRIQFLDGFTWWIATNELDLFGGVTIPKQQKPEPEPVITLDPYQFIRFFNICNEWKPVFKTNKWHDAWTAGVHRHNGMGEMCAWLTSRPLTLTTKGGSCICGKGYDTWKKEAEKLLKVKLVDYKGIVDRLKRRK